MKTVMEMAREAGFTVGPSRDGPDDVWGVGANLERFATLVAAAEREACEKACKQIGQHGIITQCVNAIRARGQA
jgi:hypothetical protein